MGKIDKLVDKMRSGPAGVCYADLRKVCEHYFGEARQSGSSHAEVKEEGK